jgi:hypothetical protein
MGQKLADLDIHEGAVFTNSLKSSQSRGSHTGGSYGRLFAFDSEGQHVLTCGSQSGIIYKVFSCFFIFSFHFYFLFHFTLIGSSNFL